MIDEEFQSLVLKQFQVLNGRMDSIDSRMDGMNNMAQDIREIKLSQVNTEQEIKDIRILFDGHKQYEEQFRRLNETLDRMEAKVDVLQLEAISVRRANKLRKG